MIKKNDGPARVSSFKKFSDMNNKVKDPEIDPSLNIQPTSDDKRPGSPNLPTTKTKVEKPAGTRSIKPIPTDGINFDEQEYQNGIEIENLHKNESKKPSVKFYGKVAKFPKGTKASKSLNFLENVKVSKSSIWYLMIEKQENELQMVKYNTKKGVDLSKFVGDLKEYYKGKYNKNQNIVKLIENIQVDGNDKYSWVKNIPLIEVEGKKMITKITEDLIKLLSK